MNYEFDPPRIPDVEQALKAAENQLALRARDAVVQVRLGNRRVIAHLPERSGSLPCEVFVGPHQVTLRPAGARRVGFPTTDEAELAMAVAVLRFVIRGKLERSPHLWGAPDVAFERGNVGKETGPEVLALRRMRYRVTTWGNRLRVVLEDSHRHVTQRSLMERSNGDRHKELGGRRALYRYGSN